MCVIQLAATLTPSCFHGLTGMPAWKSSATAAHQGQAVFTWSADQAHPLGEKKENHRQFVRALADNSDRNVRSWGTAPGCRGNVIDSDRSLMTYPLPLPGTRLHSDTLKFSFKFQINTASGQQGKKARAGWWREKELAWFSTHFCNCGLIISFKTHWLHHCNYYSGLEINIHSAQRQTFLPT